MEKPCTPLRTRKDYAKTELNGIVQLWRAQRSLLNQNLDDSLYASLSEAPKDSPEQYLEPLCEGLMDYISVGHFKVYEKLLRPAKALSSDKVELVKCIYHNIESSTDRALSFNDKYEDSRPLAKENSLNSDLHKLNRSLAIRFVLEEQLVEILA